MPARKKDVSIDVVEINTGRIDFCLLGKTPIILNRMSEKAKRELLLPRGKKTAAERAHSLKHNPIEEFRASPYTSTDPDAETLLCGLSVWFKKAIMGAAVDIPGSSKAQIGRLMWVEGERVPIYGVPKLFMAPTRGADMARTPDIRTRCIVPQWATRVSLSFVKPLLNEQVISNLLAAAGLMQGAGDWRPQKGSENYGQYDLVEESNPDFQAIVASGGREVQQAAMDNPEPYDAETEEMLDWFNTEVQRRGLEVAV